MHEKAQRILKKIATSQSGINLDDLARAFQAEAKRMLAAKGASRSAQAVGKQANSLVRNHLRPLVRQGYIKRAGRGEYTATAKGHKALGTTARPARKQPKAVKARSTGKDLRAELATIRAQLKRLAGRVEKLAKKL